MDIKMDSATMQQLVAKTIFESITPEDREKLLTGAIASIIEPTERTRRGGFGSEPGPSVLEQAFQNAAASATHQMVRDRMDNDPTFKAAIDGIISDAIKKLSEGPLRERLAEKITEQVVDGLKLRDY